MDVMLRKALRKYSGLRQQLDNVLLGDEGDTWESEFKKFLAKRPCWTGDQKKPVPAKKARDTIYTRPISDGHLLIIPPNDGIRTIAQASDVFRYIDSDFKNWNLDVTSAPTPAQPVIVHEMVKDGDFKTIFSDHGDIARLCLTQSQIIGFVRIHKKWLRTDGYGTFFLFRKGDEIPLSFENVFVADVRLFSDGGLRVHVYRFLPGHVWYAVYRHRFVLPQLTF